MNCKSCNNQINSPNLTGELCTKCYFENKRKFDSLQDSIQDTSHITMTKEGNVGEFNLSLPQDAAFGRLVEEAKLQELQESTQDTSHITLAKDDSVKDFASDLIVEEQLVKLGARSLDSEDSPKIQIEKVIESPKDGKIYCQSCIERYGNLVLASREWTPGYFICDDCFTPLLNNQLGISNTREIEKIKTSINVDSPILNQIYELLQVPESLRFNNSEQVARSYNQFFVHHATANVNLSLDALKDRLELLQTLFETIRQEIHPITDRINQLKHNEREKNQLNRTESSRDSIKGPSKIKMNKLEKEAKAMGLSLEQYQKFIKETRQLQFDKITGRDKDCSICKQNPCICNGALPVRA